MIRFDTPVKFEDSVLPADQYLFVVSSLEENRVDTQKAEDVQVIEVTLVCADGEHEGHKLRRTFYLSSAFGRSIFKRFLDAANPEVFAGEEEITALDPDDVEGRMLYIDLKIDEYKGRKTNDWASGADSFRSVDEVDDEPKKPSKKTKAAAAEEKAKAKAKSKAKAKAKPAPKPDDDDDDWD